VLAYWLRRHGFSVTVVKRAPTIRKAGGHAVDLFAPAMDIVERMGAPMQALSRRHVEIMRDDLSEIRYGATRSDVKCVYADSVRRCRRMGRCSSNAAPPDGSTW